MSSALSQVRALLFDLDGTLVDSLGDLAGACNEMLVANGHPVHAVDAYQQFIGDGVKMLVQRALPDGIDETGGEFLHCLEEYKANYTSRWAVITKPYPGIPELLETLQARAIKVGILSNKPHAMTVAMAAEFFPTTEWSVVLGQREGIPQKPDPAGAFEAAEVLGYSTKELGYLGDSGVDMQTAQAAGMQALGACWGFRGEQELRDAGASSLFADVAGFAAALAETSSES